MNSSFKALWLQYAPSALTLRTPEILRMNINGWSFVMDEMEQDWYKDRTFFAELWLGAFNNAADDQIISVNGIRNLSFISYSKF